MSIPERPEEARDSQWVMAHIQDVIRKYKPGIHSPRVLRHLAREYPSLFFTVAARELEGPENLPSSHALAEVLVGCDSFFERLTNPARCKPDCAARLFQRLLSVDPTLDFRLARMLPGRHGSDDGKALSGGQAERAIDILDRTSPGQRLLPLIAHLTESADPKICTKAALFLGKRVTHPAWIEKQLIRDDHRLRANAVEGFWGARSNGAIRIMEECAGDENPRVAANALIGLHMAGCPGVPDRTLALSRSEKPGHRSAAAWVMGKLGCPEFVERLTALMRDESPLVRSTAVRSLGEISRAEARRVEKDREETVPAREAEATVETHPENDSDVLNIPVPRFTVR